MGTSSSKVVKDTDLNTAGHYKQAFLKKRWAGTDRDGYRYSVGYAPTGAATCVGCKTKIAKGALRVGRSMPSPFDAEGGVADYTKFMHAEHAFDVMLRSRCTSKVPASLKDFGGFDALAAADKKRIEGKLRTFVKAWAAKCAPNK